MNRTARHPRTTTNPTPRCCQHNTLHHASQEAQAHAIHRTTSASNMPSRATTTPTRPRTRIEHGTTQLASPRNTPPRPAAIAQLRVASPCPQPSSRAPSPTHQQPATARAHPGHAQHRPAPLSARPMLVRAASQHTTKLARRARRLTPLLRHPCLLDQQLAQPSRTASSTRAAHATPPRILVQLVSPATARAPTGRSRARRVEITPRHSKAWPSPSQARSGSQGKPTYCDFSAAVPCHEPA